MRTSNCLFIIYYDLGVGGVQKKITDIVNYIHKSQPFSHTRIHILLENNPNRILISRIANPLVSIRIKHISRVPYWLFIVWEILKHRPGVILSFLPYASFHTYTALQWLKFLNIRFIISEDVITSHAYKRRDFSQEINGKIQRVFMSADALLVPSNAIKRDLIRHYNLKGNTISIAPNWSPMVEKSTKTNRTGVCTYIGRIDPEKRIPLMVRLFEKILLSEANASLKIIGSGKDVNKVQSYISKNNLQDHITIQSPTSDINTELRQSNVMLFTSKSEGSPLTLLEALTSGVPVVSTYFQGIEDIIDTNKSGIICHTNEHFITSVILLLRRPRLREQMGLYAQNVAQKKFSISNIQVYTNAIFKK